MSPCFICGGVVDKKRDLGAQTKVVFLLQNILGVSSSKCVEYLARFGSPCDWINICPKTCLPLISRALEAHKTILEASHNLGVIKGRVLDGIRAPNRKELRRGQSLGVIEAELRQFVAKTFKIVEIDQLNEPILNVETDIKMEDEGDEVELDAICIWDNDQDFSPKQEDEEDSSDEDETQIRGKNSDNSGTPGQQFDADKDPVDSDYFVITSRRKRRVFVVPNAEADIKMEEDEEELEFCANFDIDQDFSPKQEQESIESEDETDFWDEGGSEFGEDRNSENSGQKFDPDVEPSNSDYFEITNRRKVAVFGLPNAELNIKMESEDEAEEFNADNDPVDTDFFEIPSRRRIGGRAVPRVAKLEPKEDVSFEVFGSWEVDPDFATEQEAEANKSQDEAEFCDDGGNSGRINGSTLGKQKRALSPDICAFSTEQRDKRPSPVAKLPIIKARGKAAGKVPVLTFTTQSSRFFCCNRDYQFRSMFERHMRCHKGTRSHSCDECGKSFKEKSHLKAHKKRVHKQQI